MKHSLLVIPYISVLLTSQNLAANDRLPIVPDGFAVEVVAKEPLVRNACVLAFDRRGRIFIGQGPQWRAPKPNTPGDRVDILIDDNGDGVADRVKTFAKGFNCIQGLAWRGRDLWVANAPDLTIVRDLDGDDEADDYVRVYTGLGNLEHALHGLNFGPDGLLYMSKGNSRGYNRLDQLAPQAFRELWGLKSPPGAPDYTPIRKFKKGEYRRKYHTPADDWGQQGGILRCDVNGRNLEIVARGFRNPWDIAFDDAFNWLGTDNDQTQGDKIFAPFFGANFGWGHPWSFHWTGHGHLPTVPVSAPLFEGSGTGVIHYHAKQFPSTYRNVFFINDWLRREVYAFRPKWDGALMKCEGGFPGVFAHAGGGRTLPASSGRAFDPTDIEVGPDGCLYILSWGHDYGAKMKNGKQVDIGRVYRIRYKANPLKSWQGRHRQQPYAKWTLDQLFADLGSSIPAWRVDAQEEFLRRAVTSKPFLVEKLKTKLTTAELTWTWWTLGRLTPEDQAIETRLVTLAGDAKAAVSTRVQALRILAFRARRSRKPDRLPGVVIQLLRSDKPRIRHAAVQAIWQAKQRQSVSDLLSLTARETDRVTFYSAWNALRNLATLKHRKSWLTDRRAGVRLAAILGLFADDAIAAERAVRLRSDKDARIANLVEDWIRKTGTEKPVVTMSPPSGEYEGTVTVSLSTSIPRGTLTYTTDGSTPANTSPRYRGPITINRDTVLRVAVIRNNTNDGRVTSAEYRIRTVPPFRHRAFVTDIKSAGGRAYRMNWTGLAVGQRHYTDRNYHITRLPVELTGLAYMQTANNDDRSAGDHWLRFNSDTDVTVFIGIDARVNASLGWMKVGRKDGFRQTGLKLSTTDSVFRIYRKTFPKGRIDLGGNTNDPARDSRRGNYIVIFQRQLLKSSPERKSRIDEVLALMKTADPERGRELFTHPRGAGCIKCHQMEGRGPKYAPDLSDIGSRAKSARVLVESILKPSAVITEGFAQQKILTIRGKVHTGAVLEETGRSLKVVDSQGKATTIQKKDIEERFPSKLSPMPTGFDKLMSAQQIAHVVAWLMTQKSVGDRAGFSFRDIRDRIDIFFGKQRIATYLKQHPKLTRRALVNVTTPGGIPVTRNFPPRKPEDIDPGYKGENGIIHPVMHPGIWISFGDVNGNDYWRLKARVKFDGFSSALVGNKTTGSFSVRNRFLSEDGKRTVCIETTHYRFQRVPQGLLLRLDAEYASKDRDFYFGDQEESGLAVRVASPLRVQGGNGTIVNNRHERNGAKVWGKPAKWFDYFGTVGDRQVGLMVASNPSNSRPSWLHARDYGVVATNPFPKQPRERREPYIKTWVKRGKTFRLSYAVLIHESPADKPLDHTQAYRLMLKAFK